MSWLKKNNLIKPKQPTKFNTEDRSVTDGFIIQLTLINTSKMYSYTN